MRRLAVMVSVLSLAASAGPAGSSSSAVAAGSLVATAGAPGTPPACTPAAGAITLSASPAAPAATPVAPAFSPMRVGTCPGVRPGGFLYSPAREGLCTFNFLFTGSDGQRYVGTAGHCAIGTGSLVRDAGEKTWGPGEGPEVALAPEQGLPVGGEERVGEYAYAVLERPKDFALIRLDAGVEANPAMCHFGGPTGLNGDLTTEPVLLHYYGSGMGLGAVLPGRTAVATSMPDADEVMAAGPAVQGDSGGGVVSSDGRAVGVLTNLGVQFRFGADSIELGPIGITRLGPQVARAEEALGIKLTLQTAPLSGAIFGPVPPLGEAE